MDPVIRAIAEAQQRFATLLQRAITQAPLTVVQYQRYLSMQYHLTRGVQGYFLRAAAHPALARRRALRRFLFDFAAEEEHHYLVAAADLERMGLPLLPEPLDVTLWHAHFRAVVDDWPYLRLGAACVLENLAGGTARDATRAALAAPFLTRENTRFVVLHLHEAQPHGEQIVAALAASSPDDSEIDDLATGARQATVLYLRMMEWALFPGSLAASLDAMPPSSPTDARLVPGLAT
ncbi:hypothetical protein [Dokdonella sp.]|uniref:hypothetical protein n=1 Tax=Dokdonella sp. TaxID=2291710 RepID=UPI002F3F124F